MSDLISRADAIEAVHRAKNKDDTLHRIQSLPSADVVSREFYEDAVKANIKIVIENRELKEQIESADRPSGEWLPSNIPNEKWVCSECGGACWYYEHTMELGKSNYCPNCGARMKGGNDV